MSLPRVSMVGVRRGLALTKLGHQSMKAAQLSAPFIISRRFANSNLGDASPSSSTRGKPRSSSSQLLNDRSNSTPRVSSGDADPSTVPVSEAPSTEQILSNRSMHSIPNTKIPSIRIGNHTLPPLSSTETVLPHPIWPETYLPSVAPSHRTPEGIVDHLALWTIRAMRFNFDWMSGWNREPHGIDKALTRICFLETVAGVPGSIAAMLRHLASLRRMRRDNGWINTLLAEAENERMHLLTALQLKQPTLAFRGCVWLTQGIFFNFFFLAYIVSPRFCHRLVGFLEEEAVKTYTKILERIDNGEYKEWQTQPAPLIAVNYWKLSPNATMRNVIDVIRADEDHHREVNHNFANLRPDELNVYNKSIPSSTIRTSSSANSNHSSSSASATSLSPKNL